MAAPTPPSALLLRRLAALFYDLWICVALWLVISALFTLTYTAIGHSTRDNIPAFSLWQWALWGCCWGIAGLYAVTSWQRGGQTLGMRAWKIAVVGTDGQPASSKALWRRFSWGTLSLLLAGLGFWWALWDPDKRCWHDRASHTRLIRRPDTP